MYRIGEKGVSNSEKEKRKKGGLLIMRKK